MSYCAAKILATGDTLTMRGAKRLYFILRHRFLAQKGQKTHKITPEQVRSILPAFNYTQKTASRHLSQLVQAGWLGQDKHGCLYIRSLTKIEAMLGIAKKRQTVEVPELALASREAWLDFLAEVSIAYFAKTLRHTVKERNRARYIAAHNSSALSGQPCTPLSCSVIMSASGYRSVASASRLRTRAAKNGRVSNLIQKLELTRTDGSALTSSRNDFLRYRSDFAADLGSNPNALVQSRSGQWEVQLPNLVGYAGVNLVCRTNRKHIESGASIVAPMVKAGRIAWGAFQAK